jgi:hypothetical protein
MEFHYMTRLSLIALAAVILAVVQATITLLNQKQVVATRSQFPAEGVPCRYIDGLKTGLFHPALGLGIFDDGAIAVGDESGTVSLFDHAARGNTPPLVSIHIANDVNYRFPLAVDARRSILYVGDSRGHRVDIYKRIGINHLNLTGSLHGKLTNINHPLALTVDSRGNLYVVNLASSPYVLEFNSGSIGNVAPIRTLGGPATGLSLPVGIAVDDDGNIFVSNDTHFPTSYSVTVYPPDSTGNVTPERILSGPPLTYSLVTDTRVSAARFGRSQLNNPFGITIMNQRYLLVANAGASTVGTDRRGRRLATSAITPPITAYHLNDRGDVSPVWSLNGPRSDLSSPTAVAVDDDGDVYVQNVMSPSIVVFCGPPSLGQ